MNSAIWTLFVIIATTLTLAQGGDVRIKPVEHCDIEDPEAATTGGGWTLNGPQGKTITLKYIVSRKQFHQFHLFYNNKSLLLATPGEEFVIGASNETREMFEFPERFEVVEDAMSFELKVKNLTRRGKTWMIIGFI